MQTSRSLLARCVAVAALASAASAYAQSPQVVIDTGRLSGSVADGIAAFRGIPYAAPPLGRFRWRAPQPVKPWTGVRPSHQAHDCLQNPLADDMAPPIPPTMEDCLYLNVLAPAEKPASPLPVLFWIHGGGSVIGGTTPRIYQGEAFVRNGVIFVGVAYRLGRLGYFAHPALTAENADGMLGNYGYMDQIAALRWVKRNIAAFGGDPDNITIMGESHGGRSVQALLGTSLAKGLFRRAIIESGFGRMYQPPISASMGDGGPSAEEIGLRFARTLGVGGTDKAALARLRAMPAPDIIGTVGFQQGREGYSGPMIDGKLVPADTPDIYLSGDNQRVPLLMGGNDEDTGTSPGSTESEVYATFGPYADQARQVYSTYAPKDLAELKSLVGRDRLVLEPARFVNRIFSSEGLPVYEFRFSYVAETLRSQWAAAHHASEVPYVFNTLAEEYGAGKVGELDRQVAATMVKYWTNFMKTGDPNGAGLPVWPRFDTQGDLLMNFTAAGVPVAMPDPVKNRLDIVAESMSAVPTTPKR